jgi:hypothetical protein
MTGQVRSTWETLYECANGCGTVCILLALSDAPRQHLKGAAYRMGKWIMRNTAEIRVHWSSQRLTVYFPVATMDGKPIRYALPFNQTRPQTQ